MGDTPQPINIGALNHLRTAHDFLLQKKNGDYNPDEINLVNEYVNFLLQEAQKEHKTYKVGVLMVAINSHYWQYAPQVIQGIRQYFLPGHETEVLLWSDVGEYGESKHVNFGADKVFETETIGWPYPTLMRYHLFLNQEEYLKKFDYLFYIDLDMRIVGVVGDEILGQDLTMAQHPMYALRQNLWYPYEPFDGSTAYIQQPGRVIVKDGQTMFQPLYAAGGLQGGPTKLFIEAMEAMKKSIDKDFDNNYVARWNDESHWNKYLYEHGMQNLTVLDPSYVYPDSMIEDYYVKIWGRNYTPRIITITKPFSLQKTDAAAKLMSTS